MNPWQQGPPGSSYTLSVEADVAPGEKNVIPLAPASAVAGSKGYLVYRLYVSADASNPSLPVVTFEEDSQTVSLSTCSSTFSGMQIPQSTTSATSAVPGRSPSTPVFARSTSSTGSLFPNPDNACLSESFVPPSAHPGSDNRYDRDHGQK